MQSYVERTIASLVAASERAAIAEQVAFSQGALQRVDPRVKVAGLFALIIVVAASRRLSVIAALFVAAAMLAAASHVRMRRLAVWVWLPVLFFTGAIALPAIFLTPGRALAFAITEQGLRTAAFLIGRAETASTLSALLVLTTPWPWVLKALRIFRCPMLVVAILSMTYRYIFVILQTALEMFEARQSRTVGVLPPSERRRLASSAAGVLLSKSVQMSGEVHQAMRSRGFRGEIHLLQDFRARSADWYWLAGFALLAAAALWYGL
ncbi:MAG: cobalt ECF transporter T component CbiQ [Bryobacteraceae bacterium]|jgi:cobalt ECF transporter T component CbiQ